jgi:hypothetical protein
MDGKGEVLGLVLDLEPFVLHGVLCLRRSDVYSDYGEFFAISRCVWHVQCVFRGLCVLWLTGVIYAFLIIIYVTV